MKGSKVKTFLTLSLLLISQLSWGQAKVMNAGEAYGQIIYLTADDVKTESPKYKNINALSIPVFAELPLDLTVVAGAITLKQQNLVSHVQLKSRARHTPNLDISQLSGGLDSDLMKSLKDYDWVHMVLSKEGKILIEPSNEQAAMTNYKSKRHEPVKLPADLNATAIYKSEEISWQDNDKVGSKAANYAELGKALNTPERKVVRMGYAIPFYYYQQFIDGNPTIKAAIAKMLKDPLMEKIAKVTYREEKLTAVREMILADTSVIDAKFLNDLLTTFDQVKGKDGLPARMKLRSSTNSEDLPNFNGAGLYDSEAYKPTKDGKEKSTEKKIESLKKALRVVWASIWSLRAFDERSYFQIPHAEVKMAMQVNPTFGVEFVDGVVVTKNIAGDSSYPGAAVYIECQRGDKFNATKPEAGTWPTKMLVQYDESQPQNSAAYKVITLQKSNIADDGTTILAGENPNDMMTEAEAKDLAAQVLKAQNHFKPLLGKDKTDFALDLEFKIDSQDTGQRQVYLKQARPYID
jgi:hypothetical protein